MEKSNKLAILVVCMGNICRSPTGEAVLRAKAQQFGLDLDIDSAGTIGYHSGSAPDKRAQAAGERRGYSFAGMRARQVTAQDFHRFDLILAADRDNLADLQARCPASEQHKLKLFMSYASQGGDEIPDPYYGGEQGFERVLDMIEDAVANLLRSI